MALVDLEFDLYVASDRYPFGWPPNLSMGLTYKIQVSLESIGFKRNSISRMINLMRLRFGPVNKFWPVSYGTKGLLFCVAQFSQVVDRLIQLSIS